MPLNQEDVKKLGCALAGGIVGAALLKNHYDEGKKSQAEKDDPEGVEWLCDLIGALLDDWEPGYYEREDRYTEHLFRYLKRELRKELEEGEPSVTLELRTSTLFGIPDILINDRLVLELKVDPNKAERDRLIGQCCGYSREWVTWAIVIDMPDDCVQHLEEILEAKSLNYIHVIPFNCDEDEEDDEE
jgi:hypothetical protein